MEGMSILVEIRVKKKGKDVLTKKQMMEETAVVYWKIPKGGQGFCVFAKNRGC